MLYRECRMKSLYEIINFNRKNSMSYESLFILGGGINFAVDFYPIKSLKFVGVEGMPLFDINCILDRFFIAADVIEGQTLLEEDLNKEELYLITFSATQLNNEKYNPKTTFFGQSFGIIKQIDQSKFYVITEDKQNWLQKDLFYQSMEKGDWLFEEKSNIYRINSKCIPTINENSSLLIASLKIMLESYLVGQIDVNRTFSRFQGSISFDNLNSFIKTVATTSTNDIKAKQRYMHLIFDEIRKKIVAGTDTFYRLEFVESLKRIQSIASMDLKSSIEDWTEIASQWRQLSRELNKKCFSQSDFEIKTDITIQQLENLKSNEVVAANNLAQILGMSNL